MLATGSLCDPPIPRCLLLAQSGLFERARLTSAFCGKGDIAISSLFMCARPSSLSLLRNVTDRRKPLNCRRAQFASLALTTLAGAPLSWASSPCNLDLTDRLTVDLALATPHTLSRRCIGPSLSEA
jgi:hypothetical protein